MDVHYSSKSNDWETPQDLFTLLNCEFNFTLDPCATHENHKCDKYYTIEDDGLLKSWDNDRVFCNPPYGREIKHWVKKASISKGLVVMLIPARTDTKYFHNYIYDVINKRFRQGIEVRFIPGRLHFSNSVNSAPFPSMIVIFNIDKKWINNERR